MPQILKIIIYLSIVESTVEQSSGVVVLEIAIDVREIDAPAVHVGYNVRYILVAFERIIASRGFRINPHTVQSINQPINQSINQYSFI